MRPTFYLFVLALLATGCTSSGLSPREISGNDYSTLIYFGLPVPSAVSPATAPVPLHQKPLRIGVVQIGEVAPPTSMLAVLRSHPELIARAEALPGVLYEGDSQALFTVNPTTGPVDADAEAADRENRCRARVRRELNRIRAVASDLGLDTLILFGGHIDWGSRETPLSIFNLTIIGYYIAPTQRVSVHASAAAAVIDLATGRPACTASAEATESRLTPSAGSDGVLQERIDAARDDVRQRLAEQIISRLK